MAVVEFNKNGNIFVVTLNDPVTGNALTPDLRTVQELRNYTCVFAKPDSEGKPGLWNCPHLKLLQD